MHNVVGSIVTLAVKVLGVVFRQPSWANWLVLLKGAFALPLSADELVVFCRLTGRTRPPARPVREAWFIIGRRAGKSMIAALIAIYACCCRTYTLAPGEVGVFMIIAADRRQARVIKRYISGLLKAAAVLRPFIEKETQAAIVLTNGLVIEIHTASFRTIRGYTCIGAVCDETAFWPVDESANPDTEILNALRPAMATVPEAILVCITSPYARRGEAWKAVRDHFGHDDDTRLVALADTATMNPTIPAEIIEQAFRDDPVAAAAEYGTDGRVEFRSDVESYISEEAIDAVTGARAELPPIEGVTYRGSFDGAGGSAAGGDSQTLAIAHDEGDRTVLDVVREVAPPFSPEAVIVQDFAPLLKTYHIDRVVGDRWAGEWPRAAFRKANIVYDVCAHAKSDLYRALLPRINSGLVELRTIPKLLAQLAGLERHTARGGKDSIDHRPGSHDDLVNVAAIVLSAPRESYTLHMWAPGDAPDTRSVDQIQEEHEKEQAERIAESAREVEEQCRNGGWWPGGR